MEIVHDISKQLGFALKDKQVEVIEALIEMYLVVYPLAMENLYAMRYYLRNLGAVQMNR